MLFSNLTDGETISFKYYHAASGEVFCLSETVDFESDMIIANAIAPFTFNLDVEFVLGCNDQSACNYDPTSNFNDGSCEYLKSFMIVMETVCQTLILMGYVMKKKF